MNSAIDRVVHIDEAAKAKEAEAIEYAARQDARVADAVEQIRRTRTAETDAKLEAHRKDKRAWLEKSCSAVEQDTKDKVLRMRKLCEEKRDGWIESIFQTIVGE